MEVEDVLGGMVQVLFYLQEIFAKALRGCRRLLCGLQEIPPSRSDRVPSISRGPPNRKGRTGCRSESLGDTPGDAVSV